MTDICYAACDVDYAVRPFCFNDGCRSTIDTAIANCHKSCDNVSTAMFTACEVLATPIFAASVLTSEAACTTVCQQMAARAVNATFADIPEIAAAGPEAIAAAVVAMEGLGVAIDYGCYISCSAIVKMGLPTGVAGVPMFCEYMTGVHDPHPAPKPTPHPPVNMGCDGKSCGGRGNVRPAPGCPANVRVAAGCAG